jgi:hypothetical protein
MTERRCGAHPLDELRDQLRFRTPAGNCEGADEAGKIPTDASTSRPVYASSSPGRGRGPRTGMFIRTTTDSGQLAA